VSATDIKLKEVQRILIIKMSSLGDVVHALPVLTAVRRRFPEAYIAWLVRGAAEELVAGHQALDITYVLGRTSDSAEAGLWRFHSAWRLARALRAERFDLSLDLQGLFRASVFGWLARARWRVGFRNHQELTFLFNNLAVIPDRRDLHAVDGYLAFAHYLDAPVEPVEFGLPVHEQDREWADDFLHRHGAAEAECVVALMPGARWETKRWPPDRFAAVAELIAQRFDVRFLITGGPDDRTAAQAIAALTSGARVIDATGQTRLRQLSALLMRCRLAITNDSGPMHLAAALGVPIVAIFGPTDPRRVGPYGEGHRVIRAGLDCAPCYRRRCNTLECMRRIPPAEVAQAASELMGQTVPCAQ